MEDLTEEEFQVIRKKGTEPPFSGKYYDCKNSGTYVCRSCGTPLFSSEQKYDSGSGWPSFWQPASELAVEETPDKSHGMNRTEIVCKKCSGHLGHVFPDGPKPTGLRYCINSTSLQLTKSTK